MSHKPHTSSSDRTWGTQDIWNKEGKQQQACLYFSLHGDLQSPGFRHCSLEGALGKKLKPDCELEKSTLD